MQVLPVGVARSGTVYAGFGGFRRGPSLRFGMTSKGKNKSCFLQHDAESSPLPAPATGMVVTNTAETTPIFVFVTGLTAPLTMTTFSCVDKLRAGSSRCEGWGTQA